MAGSAAAEAARAEGTQAAPSTPGERLERAVVGAVRTVDADSRARTHLANERTFLAWLRTGLSLVALGLAIAHFLDPDGLAGPDLALALGVVLVISGIAVTAAGGRRFLRARDQIEAGTYRPDAPVVVLSVALVALAGLAALAYVFGLG